MEILELRFYVEIKSNSIFKNNSTKYIYIKGSSCIKKNKEKKKGKKSEIKK